MANDVSEFECCFVLGAGASCDFGYPTGLELIRNISKSLLKPSEKLLQELDLLESVAEMLEAAWSTNLKLSNYCQMLGNRIYFSGVTSIDRFISINQDNNVYQDICKYMIVRELLSAERRSLNPCAKEEGNLSNECFRWRQNWLRVFFGCFFVKNTIDDLLKYLECNKVCFISFNYDRLMEYFLVQAIINLYGLEIEGKPEDLKKLNTVMNAVKILHVYGKFDGKNIDIKKLLRDYGALGGDISSLSKNIQTIRFDQTLPDEYSLVIEKSKKVYFLGFGFDDMNVNILTKNIGFPTNKFRSTNYGLSDQVINKINVKFKHAIDWPLETDKKLYEFVNNRFGS
ncbi:MAG: hypothetical protein AB7F70_00785 [Candidatus Omnitrophota bacterium]